MHTPMGGSEEAEEGKGKSTVSCEWIAGPARWLTGLGLALSKAVGGEFVFTVVTPSISSSSPFPPPLTPKYTHTHTHTSYPDTCPVMCPTLRLEARLPDPQGSRDLSLILLPDLWLSISHQPPSAPQSICPTLADLTSSSLTFTSLNSTLYYHVPSPDVPPNEKAVSMRLETLSDPLCSSRRALQCWDHTRCFMNIQECAGLFTSSLHLLYG